jgi:type II secretion system protein J
MKIARVNSTGRTQWAFTLIEILMALAIFTMVLAAIYATWTALLRGSRVGLEVAAQAQRERVAVRTIEQALSSARSFVLDVQHYGFVAENGDDAMLSFVARLPKSFPRSGRFGEFDVRRVAFSLEDGPDSQRQLVVRQCPLLMEFDEDEANHPLVLARNVKELLFEFWDTRLNDWTDTWTQTNQLPKLVRVSIQMLPPNRQNTSAEVEETSRIISVPSIAVPANWQRPNPQQPLGGANPNLNQQNQIRP